MNHSTKTALVAIIVVIGGIAGISFALSTLDATVETISLPDGIPAILPILTDPAPDLVGIAHYINTTPEELEEKIDGSVVLYDIWTYSCINCIRTLPYITSWNEAYADDGLLIIGVHSPEFEFEKDLENVEHAVQKHGITYPVVMDNDMETWKAFENRYWPRKYVADHTGNIRYDHIGEGDYDNTERVIQSLLRERADYLGMQVDVASGTVDVDEYVHGQKTPELYFGYAFAAGRNNLGNIEGFSPGSDVTYEIPTVDLRDDYFYIDGTWNNNRDGMTLISETGIIRLSYHAKQVNIVAGSDAQADLGIYINGEPITAAHAGDSVADGIATIGGHGLYNIVTSDESSRQNLEIRISEPGFEMFTFTFG